MFIVRRRNIVCALVLVLLISALLFPPIGSRDSSLQLSGVVAHAAVLPELPRVYLDTTYQPPSGRTITVPAGGDLQAAFNNAAPGDIIELQAGATFTGNFWLPQKSGSGWIYVRSSAHASLPPAGTRVSPAQAPMMPKIVGNPAIATASGTHHYRFVGIEFSTLASGSRVFVVNLTGNNIVLDRSWIHGGSGQSVTSGVVLNGTYLAVIDSYISEIHHTWEDAQAIWGWNGAGPFKIVNNYLEASGENVMFGGTDASSQANMPSDIEIRGNYMFKPLTWKVGDPSYAGTNWVVKNTFELKNAQRVLFEGNILEHNWTGNTNGQSGQFLMLTPRNQGGGNPWAYVRDVTIRRNIFKKAAEGGLILGWDDINSSQQLQRVLVQDNLWLDIGIWPDLNWGNTGILIQTKDAPADVTIDHNTAFPTKYLLAGLDSGGRGPATGFSYANNIVLANQGVGGAGSTLQSLNTYFTGYLFTRNVLVGGTPTSYPPDNFFPTALSLVGFVNSASGDYSLAATSPYKYLGTDGKDPGADIAALVAATASTITGAGPVAADTTPPTVALTAPLPSTSVSGTVTVSASAADNAGVAGVQFKLNGGNLGPEDTTNAYSVFWDSTKVVNGSYTLTALARDEAGNTTTSAPVTVTVDNPDTTPAIISSATVSSITSAGASISWTTNEPADSQVEYGLTTSYGGATSVNPTMVTAHAVTLSSLAASTTYHYRVKSKDAAGNLATSSDFTFTTAPAPDTLPPSPPTGLTATAVSTSRIDLTWSASTDNVGVAGYKIFRDGVQVATVSSNPYQNTGLSSGTTYAYAVAAFDAAGNTSAQSSSISATTLAIVQAAYKGTPRTVPGQIEAEDFDDGGEGVAYHDAVPGNAGGQYRLSEDVDVFRLSNGAYVVRNFETGEWLEYTINVTQAGTYRLELLVSNLAWSPTPRWHAEIDGVSVTTSVAIPNTGSWSTYQWVGANGIPLSVGEHVLRVVADQQYFDFAALRLTRGRAPFKGMPFEVPGAQIEAEDFDNGGETIAYHDNVSGNAGGVYRTDVDVDIFLLSNGADVVRNFETGEWLEYTLNVTQTGTYRLDLLASNHAWSPAPRWHAEIDGAPVTGSVAVPNTGSWSTFQWVGVDGIGLITGPHVLRITADQQYFDFAALRLTQVSTRAPFKGAPFSMPGQVEAEDFDWGGEGVAYHDLVSGNAGGQYRLNEDADIFRLSNGAYVVRNFQTGEWLEYTIHVAQTGTYRLELLVSSASFVISRWHAEIDGAPVTGSVAVPNAGWDTFQWVGADGITLTAGQHILRIVADQQYFDFAVLRLVQ